MDLADFIEANIRPWSTIGQNMPLQLARRTVNTSKRELRNSATDILTAIVADMREPQSAAQQQSNSAARWG